MAKPKATAKTTGRTRQGKTQSANKSIDRESVKVLEYHMTTQELRATYEKNASESPLLHFPPELRNRTWSYVLGGNIIHIFHGTRRSRRRVICHSLCKATENEISVAKEAKASNGDNGASVDAWCTLHRTCDLLQKPSNVCLSIDLLATCRQIYLETALIPFAQNIFAFQFTDYMSNIGNSLAPFLNRMTLAQTNAIKSISIKYDELPSASAKTARPYEKRLQGLKEIVIWREFKSDIGLDDDFNYMQRYGCDILRKEPLLNFERLALEKVTVVVDPIDIERSIVAARQMRGVLREWEDVVEKRLMEPWDGLTSMQRSRKKLAAKTVKMVAGT